MAPSAEWNWSGLGDNSAEARAVVQVDSDYVSENVQGKPLKDFSIFQHFPLEVREVVWKFACQASRTIDIHVASTLGCKAEILNDVPVPAILHVNYEARVVGLQNFALVSNFLPNKVMRIPPFYTNYQFDKYHLSWATKGRRSRLFPSFRYMEQDREAPVSRRLKSSKAIILPIWTPLRGFPTLHHVPDILSDIQHLQINLDLEPHSTPFIDQELFRTRSHNIIYDFLQTFKANVTSYFTALKSITFVVHRQTDKDGDANAELELRSY